LKKQGIAREEALKKLTEANKVAVEKARVEADQAAKNSKEALDTLVTKGLLESIALSQSHANKLKGVSVLEDYIETMLQSTVQQTCDQKINSFLSTLSFLQLMANKLVYNVPAA